MRDISPVHATQAQYNKSPYNSKFIMQQVPNQHGTNKVQNKQSPIHNYLMFSLQSVHMQNQTLQNLCL